MKKIHVKFDLDRNARDIKVLVTASEKDEQVCDLMNRLEDPLAGKIAVYDTDGAMTTIQETDIISISTDKRRLAIRAGSGTYKLKTTLKDLRRQLHPQMFIQISRFEIINLEKVRRFDFTVTGTLLIEMEDGTTTWASRRLIPEIKDRLTRKEQTV
jgi:DNA-binding LytR/AlgR family response regulator